MAALTVPSSDLKKGLFNRLRHKDVDSTFESLQEAVEKVRLYLEKLRSDHETLSICHYSHYEEVKREIRCDRVDLVMHKERIDKHSETIVALHADSSDLKGRMKALEDVRDQDQEAESQNVAAIDQLNEKLATGIQTLTLRCADIEVDQNEERAKLKGIFQTFEELTSTCVQLKKENQLFRTQMTSLAQVVHQLVANTTQLSAWKEQATKQQERHEQILIHSQKMQESLTEILSSMNQDQQYLKQGVGLLCEKQGIQIEKPGFDFTAPFKALLGSLGAVKQAFSTGTL